MKILSLIISFFVSGICFAGEILTVKSMSYIEPKSQDCELNDDMCMTIPFVYSKNKDVADRINNFLFIIKFGIMAPKEYSKNFGKEINLQGIASHNFLVVQNNETVLALKFTEEACGAFCEKYSSYYTFDTDTGDNISPEELFNESGRKALAKRIINYRNSLYRKQIKLLKKELSNFKRKKAREVNDESEEDMYERIELNERCIKDISEYKFYYDQFNDVLNFKFNISSVDIITQRCSGHAMRALDDVGDITMPISYRELKPYLTDYGRSLFLNKPKKKFTKSVYGKILTGKIGERTSVTMLLHKYSANSLSGVYFYNKYGKAIKLSGTASGDNLKLKEYAEDEVTVTAEINLKIIKDKLIGNWTGGNKSIPIELDL